MIVKCLDQSSDRQVFLSLLTVPTLILIVMLVLIFMLAPPLEQDNGHDHEALVTVIHGETIHQVDDFVLFFLT